MKPQRERDAARPEEVSEALDPSARLVFLHIPKTGGITLHHIIGRQYPKPLKMWFSYDRPEQVARFDALDQQQRAAMRCIEGHFPFGLHEQFPGRSRYITLLRDPVARFISEFGHMQRVERPGAWSPPRERVKSLDDYLDYRLETHALDVQTRIVSGYMPPPGQQPPFDPLPEDALERAKENLVKHFSVVGLTERFDESLLLMRDQHQWQKRIAYSRKNAAPKPARRADIDPGTMDRIVEHTRIDAELVNYAGELLDRAVAAAGDGFQQELEKLQRANHRLYLLDRLGKRLFPAALRQAPGVRHARSLARRLLR